MKILFIENNLAGGGAEKVLLTLLEQLQPPKYDITLLLIKNKGIYLDAIPSYVKLQYMIDINKSNAVFPTDAKSLCEFYQSNIGEEYDVEIAFLEGPPTKLLAYSTNKHSKKIAWVHIDLEKVHWTYSYYSCLQEEFDCYKKLDKVVFVSDNARIGFERLFNKTLKNSIVINNPINCIKIKLAANSYKVSYEGFTCIIVGSLVNRKSHSRLIYAIGRLFQLGYRFHLYVVGEGNEECSLKELCHILGIYDYVHFVGFQKNPYPYIADANLLISSSISEGYPLVCCEALTLGVPILATDCTGNRDVLKDGKYGLLVDNSEEGIFCGLKSILDCPTYYIQLKNKACLGSEECQFNVRIDQIKNLLEGKDYV